MKPFLASLGESMNLSTEAFILSFVWESKRTSANLTSSGIFLFILSLKSSNTKETLFLASTALKIRIQSTNDFLPALSACVTSCSTFKSKL